MKKQKAMRHNHQDVDLTTVVVSVHGRIQSVVSLHVRIQSHVQIDGFLLPKFHSGKNVHVFI